jgi:hypothetical protein
MRCLLCLQASLQQQLDGVQAAHAEHLAAAQQQVGASWSAGAVALLDCCSQIYAPTTMRACSGAVSAAVSQTNKGAELHSAADNPNNSPASEQHMEVQTCNGCF